MRRSASRYLAMIQDDAAGRLADRLAKLRILMVQRRAVAKREGRIEETPALRRRRWEELATEHRTYDDIRKRIGDMLEADESKRNQLMLELGDELLDAAERGNSGEIQAFIEEGFPVTWQDPENGLTALHIVAARQARKALRVLLATDQCDFLLRDNRGRLPSEMAYLYGRDVAVARLLGNRERKQAEAQGIKLTRRLKVE